MEIQMKKVGRLCKEYADLINLKDNAEIVLMEVMEAIKQLNTTIEPGNNQAHDKAAAKQIVAQGVTAIQVSGMCIDECMRLVQSHKGHEGDRNSPSPGQLMDANAQYWSNLSNKATCHSHSCRALELQLKMAEEKVNILLHEESSAEVLLEAAQEVHSIHFQLVQNTCLHEAGLIPEQQMRFSADTGGNINNLSRNYGVNLIPEDRGVAGARIEEVILEKDEGQTEEFDEGAPHPEEQQDWEDQPEKDDQQYHCDDDDDDEYKMRLIDKEVVHVNAVIKASCCNDHHRVYGIGVQEVKTDLRVSEVVQTGGKEQLVYDY
ncbi:hypothetical protein M422DRAFT_251998 [Sphaerobolus stellatus SS14]|uniref:Uncharacterized protein n=1 Tax=Sphaerobolus stellatus (strain SS14) TaxID=990650 RepID=A0A0C9VQS6_SPHS4|nr:hypothetical protein M422DRAFT_251998 [Sphaerobolus stellatus SS14]